ncbi:hypothetical protein TSST111916_06680 [Tsukamurella strandjordii]
MDYGEGDGLALAEGNESHFVWTNYSNQWKPLAGPLLGAALGTLGLIIGIAGSMPGVVICSIGMILLFVGMLSPQVGSRNSTICVHGSGVRIGHAPWWRNSATYLVASIAVLAVGLSVGATDGTQRSGMVLPVALLGTVVATVIAYIIFRNRGAFVIESQHVITARGVTIPFEKLNYGLFEPPRGAPSVRFSSEDIGSASEYMTAFGYLIDTNNVLSTLDALTSLPEAASPQRIYSMLTVRPPEDIPIGSSVSVTIYSCA